MTSYSILIDTQVLVWMLNDDPKLGKKARRLLENAANEVAVSYFSLLEIVLKAAIGKMTYDDSIYEDIDAMNISLLPAGRQALAAYKIFDKANKDPFDNLLLTITALDKYDLMTSDSQIFSSQPDGLMLINALV